MADFKTGVSQAEKILEQVMAVEPEIAAVVGVFVPGIGVVQPWILALAPAMETAMKAIVAGDNVSMVDALATLAKHVLPGLPNAPALSGASASVSG